jgi:hypothetical protein
VKDADLVVADMYPFDADLQFAYDRGFWPLHQAKRDASKIVLAACPIGVGDHELFPPRDNLLLELNRRHTKPPVKVAVYKYAPFLIDL